MIFNKETGREKYVFTELIKQENIIKVHSYSCKGHWKIFNRFNLDQKQILVRRNIYDFR